MPYAIQNVFVLLGPALFAASIYMCLSRIIRGVRGERHSPIRPSRLTKTFVTGDVLSFVVQGGAAGLMVSGKNAKMGEGMVIGGLMIQIIMFGLFAVTAMIFKRRIERSPPTQSCSSSLPWQGSMRMLYVVSALIMVRSIFRVAEYAMGNDGYLLRHEWTLYVFDSTLMFIVMVVYCFWYPTWITPDKLPVQPESYSVWREVVHFSTLTREICQSIARSIVACSVVSVYMKKVFQYSHVTDVSCPVRT